MSLCGRKCSESSDTLCPSYQTKNVNEKVYSDLASRGYFNHVLKRAAKKSWSKHGPSSRRSALSSFPRAVSRLNSWNQNAAA